MVAIAAFLIVCVILFGVENVRNFFFGTLGVAGWVIAILFVLGLAIVSIDKFGKILDERKKAKAEGKKPENGDTVFLVVFLAILFAGVFVYCTFFMPKYNVLYAFPNTEQWAIDKNLEFKNQAECKAKASTLNLSGGMFNYKCGKNCKPDASGIYVLSCEETY